MNEQVGNLISKDISTGGLLQCVQDYLKDLQEKHSSEQDDLRTILKSKDERIAQLHCSLEESASSNQSTLHELANLKEQQLSTNEHGKEKQSEMERRIIALNRENMALKSEMAQVQSIRGLRTIIEEEILGQELDDIDDLRAILLVICLSVCLMEH